jgi:2-iminobutanoate/2-iminopropanoate deaminase
MASSEHQPVVGHGLPKVIGPYSPAIRWGRLVFCSGQLGVDPASGTLAQGIEAQTRQALANVSDLLEAAGSAMGQVLKTTVFLTDLADFTAMNAVYADCFGENRPARSTVQVAALPLGGCVEIEVVAYVP